MCGGNDNENYTSLGNTTPEIDKILAPYYKMSIDKYEKKYKLYNIKEYKELARKDAYIDMKQSLQGLEIKLNTVVSARGSYPSIVGGLV